MNKQKKKKVWRRSASIPVTSAQALHATQSDWMLHPLDNEPDHA